MNEALKGFYHMFYQLHPLQDQGHFPSEMIVDKLTKFRESFPNVNSHFLYHFAFCFWMSVSLSSAPI